MGDINGKILSSRFSDSFHQPFYDFFLEPAGTSSDLYLFGESSFAYQFIEVFVCHLGVSGDELHIDHFVIEKIIHGVLSYQVYGNEQSWFRVNGIAHFILLMGKRLHNVSMYLFDMRLLLRCADYECTSGIFTVNYVSCILT